MGTLLILIFSLLIQSDILTTVARNIAMIIEMCLPSQIKIVLLIDCVPKSWLCCLKKDKNFNYTEERFIKHKIK